MQAARNFGDIEIYDSTLSQYLLPAHPEIIVLSNIEKDGKPIGVVDAGTYWHTDRSYVDQAGLVVLPVCTRGSACRRRTPLGDTEFANMTAAYQALSPAEQERLGKLSAWHEYVFRFSEKNASMPGVSHPIVLKHPLTRAPCLYVNKGFTHRILELPDEEGSALLEKLFEHARREEFVYRHRWQVGDLLMWDNYGTQHRATGGYALPQRRHMWRTTIQGFPLQ